MICLSYASERLIMHTFTNNIKTESVQWPNCLLDNNFLCEELHRTTNCLYNIEAIIHHLKLTLFHLSINEAIRYLNFDLIVSFPIFLVWGATYHLDGKDWEGHTWITYYDPNYYKKNTWLLFQSFQDHKDFDVNFLKTHDFIDIMEKIIIKPSTYRANISFNNALSLWTNLDIGLIPHLNYKLTVKIGKNLRSRNDDFLRSHPLSCPCGFLFEEPVLTAPYKTTLRSAL